MIEILDKGDRCWEPGYGKIPYGSSLIARESDVTRILDERFVQLNLLHADPVISLSMIDVATGPLSACRYKCPVSKNEYNWVLPLVIMAENPDGYKPSDMDKNEWSDMIVTNKKIGTNPPTISNPRDYLSEMALPFLVGHGYCEHNVPIRSSVLKRFVEMDLSNGDTMMCFTFIIYNG